MINNLSKKSIPIWNQRMLQLLDENPYKTAGEWWEYVGSNQSNLRRIRSGAHSFTIPQMIRAATLHKTTLDWICGLTDDRTNTPTPTPIEMIEEGLRRLKERS